MSDGKTVVERIVGYRLERYERLKSECIAFAESGMRSKDVYRHFGGRAHRDTLRKWLRSAGLTERIDNSAIRKRAIELSKSGKTTTEIHCEISSVSLSTIQRWVREAGLFCHVDSWWAKSALKPECVRLAKLGLTASQIYLRFKRLRRVDDGQAIVSLTTIQNWLRACGYVRRRYSERADVLALGASDLSTREIYERFDGRVPLKRIRAWLREAGLSRADRLPYPEKVKREVIALGKTDLSANAIFERFNGSIPLRRIREWLRNAGIKVGK